EFGPTPIPVQKETSSGVRSMTDEFFVDRLAQNTERLEQIIRQRSKTVTVTRDLVPERTRKPDYKRAVDLVGDTVWVIHPPALATIVAIVSERASGYKPTAEEIKARIGTRAE